jgi:hypothetical protein
MPCLQAINYGTVGFPLLLTHILKILACHTFPKYVTILIDSHSVDISVLQVPDYHLIIKRPMDFGKMKYKLNMLEYRNNSEFIADALLVFENCQMYNQVDAQEYK